MPKLPNPVDFAVPFFILLIVLEMIWARRTAALDPDRTWYDSDRHPGLHRRGRIDRPPGVHG